MREVDVLVLGGGPAGCRAAVESARLRAGAKVALVERMSVVGGVCVNTGTIPSKTLRQAVLYLTGYSQRAFYGREHRPEGPVTQEALNARTRHVIEQELRVLQAQLGRVGIELVVGDAHFVGPHEVLVDDCTKRTGETWRAGTIFIATGSEALRTPGMPYDGRTVLVPDELLELPALPRTMTIVGGGVIGSEYASIYALAGIAVTLVDSRPRLLEFLDNEILDVCLEEMKRNGVTFALGRTVARVERESDGRTALHLSDGSTVVSDIVVTAAGRTGAVGTLDLAEAGLKADERGRIAVDRSFRTAVPHIYAAGDVIGFPSLASAATEQGRVAAVVAATRETPPLPGTLPIGIYTVPEMAAVGKTEATLRREGVRYQASRANWSDISRGHITGDELGMLKLLWDCDTRKILGVHIVGEGASELIHLGHAVMSLGGTIDYFVESVFNYPTLAQAYKLAVDGIPCRTGESPKDAG